MKRSVSIARALKEKNRVAGRLAKARELIGKENSMEAKIPRSVDVAAVLALAKALEANLIAIKAAIAEANAPIIAKIIELDEVKSEIAFFNGLDAKEGVYEESNYSGRVLREFNAVISKSSILSEISALQKRADALQDELDEFNASSKVMIDIED